MQTSQFAILGFILLFISIIGASLYFDKKRREAFGLIAARIGFSYTSESRPEIITTLGSLKIFNIGHARKAYNVLSGTWKNISCLVFDYRYTTGHGKHSHTHTQSVVCVKLSNLLLPEFYLGPENFFHRIGEILGFKDIDFSNNPSFSEKYILKGENEDVIRSFFNDSRLLFFAKRQGGFVLEADADKLIYYVPNRAIKPEEVPIFLDEAAEIVSVLCFSQPNI